MTTMDNEFVVTPRPMNDRQLMVLFEIKHFLSWKKALRSIAGKLTGRKREGRYTYSKEEVLNY